MGLKEASCCTSLRNECSDDLLPLVANPGLAGALVLQVSLLVGLCSQDAQ